MINLHGRRFEVEALVSEIHDNIGMVMRINNVYEMEGMISTRGLMLTFPKQIHSFLL